jgi:hypothetical protein
MTIMSEKGDELEVPIGLSKSLLKKNIEFKS